MLLWLTTCRVPCFMLHLLVYLCHLAAVAQLNRGKEPPPQLASDESEDISPELEPVARLNPTFEREGITLTSVGDLDSYAAFGQGPFLSGSRSVAGPLAVLLLTSNRN
jgi:hypothetical protein